MQEIKSLAAIEQEFSDVLEALSTIECQSNRKLPGKTKKVAELFAKVAKKRTQSLEGDGLTPEVRPETRGSL